MRNALARLLNLLRRYCVVARPGNRLTKTSLLPLAAVLPIAVYAYAMQAVVTSQTLRHERILADLDLRNLAQKLQTITKRDVAAICRDYAHWDDTYHQVLAPDPTWLERNIDCGLASTTFDLDLILLQDRAGKVVYGKGANEAVLADVRRYGLLQQCLKNPPRTGTAILDGRAYLCAADAVLKGDHTGRPRGMLLVARLLDSETLAELRPGTQHRIVLRLRKGEVVGVNELGPLRKLPACAQDVLFAERFPEEPSACPCTENAQAYGFLPMCDLAGRPIGVLVDVRSMAATMAFLRTIKHMSISLMLLCAVIAAVGFGYLSNRALALRAHRDELTGLYNHGYLQEHLRSQVQLAERYGRPMAVLMVDIDHFKYVNDSHGHATGDTILKVLAQTMVRTMRGTDVAARYGGEEFVVVMPETDLLQALSAAERLRTAVQEQTVPIAGVKDHGRSATELSFTVSVGVASYPDDGGSAPELLEAADTALMEAKRTRNTVCAYRDVVKGLEPSRKQIEKLDAFLRDSSIATIRPLVAAIDTRDPGSVLHSQKTAEYAVAMGRVMGLTTHELAVACKAALLHDVGMIGVPDSILTKSDKLTDEELSIVRRHCRLGADIILRSPQLAAVAEIVLHHHERWDGTGYPDGLAGENIPLIARIIAAADSLDAMTSPRAYKQAVPLRDALQELRAQAGKQFDPRVVEAAERVIADILEQQEHKRAAA